MLGLFSDWSGCQDWFSQARYSLVGSDLKQQLELSWRGQIMGSLTAEQLSVQLRKLKQNLTAAEQISADKVVQNFLDLHLPVNSEVSYWRNSVI